MATAKAEREAAPVTLTVTMTHAEAKAFRLALESSAANGRVAMNLSTEFYDTLAKALAEAC